MRDLLSSIHSSVVPRQVGAALAALERSARARLTLDQIGIAHIDRIASIGSVIEQARRIGELAPLKHIPPLLSELAKRDYFSSAAAAKAAGIGSVGSMLRQLADQRSSGHRIGATAAYSAIGFTASTRALDALTTLGLERIADTATNRAISTSKAFEVERTPIDMLFRSLAPRFLGVLDRARSGGLEDLPEVSTALAAAVASKEDKDQIDELLGDIESAIDQHFGANGTEPVVGKAGWSDAATLNYLMAIMSLITLILAVTIPLVQHLQQIARQEVEDANSRLEHAELVGAINQRSVHYDEMFERLLHRVDALDEALQEANGYTAKVSAENLSVRWSPESNIVAYVEQGEMVHVLGKNGKWAKIRFEGDDGDMYGWVLKKHLVRHP